MLYIYVQMTRRHPKTMTMSEARASFAKVLTRAEQGEAVQVTRGGKPVAVIISMADYEQALSQHVLPSEAFRNFMETFDRRVLRGKDPWEATRDRSVGREFRW